jgi:hypothetical protein
MKKESLSVLELRQQLIDVLEHSPNLCVRFRMLGEMWQVNMMRLVGVTEDRALLHDEIANKLLSIKLDNVMQFEIDNCFKELQPFFHYTITVTPNSGGQLA